MFVSTQARDRGGEHKAHRRIGLDRTPELERGPAFLDNFGVLPMQPPLLILLHPGNLFLNPVNPGQNLSPPACQLPSEVPHLFFARRSLSASPVGASASAVVFSSSIACRFFT